jgi:D-threonate/D-erythronate kinase
VRDGLLYVHGTLVHQTAFANDPISPVNESCLRTIISRHLDAPVHVVHPRELPPRLERGVYICNGENDDDIEAAAAYAVRHDDVIVAGPAAIAQALAASRASSNPTEPQWPSVRSCLVVNGSKHPISEEQCGRARAAGWPVTHFDDLRAATQPMHSWSVLDLQAMSEQNSFARSAEIGRLLSQFVARWAPDAVMIIGGDTCYGFLKALGKPDLHPLGELCDGVPCSIIGGNALLPRDLCLISKAGGFGSVDLLMSVKAAFDRGSSR